MLDAPLIPDLPLEAWPVWALALFWIWIAVLGAAIGSFLNVVIYRSPRGMSLVHPGSQCPKCGHAIRARDNLPVVGWLVLRGKCRDCGAAISARYPMIEAFVGLLFLGVAALYLGLHGISLLPSPSELTFPQGEQQLAGIAAFHLALITFLLAAAGMRIDGQAMPRRLIVWAIVAGLLLPCLWPWLRPLGSGLPVHGSAERNAFDAGLAGAFVGIFVGWLRSGKFRFADSPSEASIIDPRLYVVTGVCLGWQAVVAVALLASILGLIADGAGKAWKQLPVWPDEVGQLLAVLLLLGSWRWETQAIEQIPLEKRYLAFMAIVAIAAISGIDRLLRPQIVSVPAKPASRKKKKR